MKREQSEISPRQQQIVEFIRRFQSERGYPPTIREIGRAVDISSTSVVHYNLKALRRLGYLRRDADVSRGIELLSDGENGRSSRRPVPIIGRIAAGEPIEALPGHHEQLDLPPSLSDTDAYALQVKGKSMIEDLIDDGDIVVVRPQSTADNGDIVVALLPESPGGDGVATLKRFYRERGRIRLQPANSAMQAIYVDPEDLQIQGRAIAVIRQIR